MRPPATCRDCGGPNPHGSCGSCCECYCETPQERAERINPVCGHLERQCCPGCGVCQGCDGCYCGEV
jgi:hypothetical protein